MNKHTELPWAVCREPKNKRWMEGLTVYSESTGHRLFDTASLNRGKYDNADFIVKACNNHYRLINIVKRMLAQADLDEKFNESKWPKSIIEEANQAIKDAS